MTANIARGLALLTFGALAAGGAGAADSDGQTRGAGPVLFLSHDSEGFNTRRLALEYLPVFKSGDSLAGVRYSANHFEQNGWSRSGQQISAVARHIDPATANGWQIDAGLARQGGHDQLSLDGSYRHPLAERSAVEVFINRDWVETRNALDDGIDFTFAGVALEQGVGPHVTLVGTAAYQDFSDGNHRNHARLRVIYQPRLDLGLTLQARYRMYTSGTSELPGAYFNPDRYSEAMFALGWRQRIQGWMATATAGLGQQRLTAAPHTSTRLLELGLQTPPGGHQSVRLRAGVSRSASFGGPDYTYRYAQAEWIVRF